MDIDFLNLFERKRMHAASGTFTAPQGGVYFFTISAVSNGSSKDLYIDVIKNGNKEFDIDAMIDQRQT